MNILTIDSNSKPLHIQYNSIIYSYFFFLVKITEKKYSLGGGGVIVFCVHIEKVTNVAESGNFNMLKCNKYSTTAIVFFLIRLEVKCQPPGCQLSHGHYSRM